jgi:hypothetical protein
MLRGRVEERVEGLGPDEEHAYRPWNGTTAVATGASPNVLVNPQWWQEFRRDDR